MIKKYVLTGVLSLCLGFGSFGAMAQVIGEAEPADVAKQVENDSPAGNIRSGLPGEAIQSLIFKADGTKIGFAVFRKAPRGVIISVNVSKLTSGWHGLHIHEVADCRSVKAFASFDAAGGHLGSGGLPHGFMTPGGPQNGDLPNIWIGTDGTGRAEFYSDILDFEDVVKNKGRSFIVDEKPDDHINQPSGGSGAHIACGTIHREAPDKQ